MLANISLSSSLTWNARKETEVVLVICEKQKSILQSEWFLSNLEHIYGESQESRLEPLLFLVYIDDLHLALKNGKVNMFARVIPVFFSSGSIADVIADANMATNADLEDPTIWLESNKLSL